MKLHDQTLSLFHQNDPETSVAAAKMATVKRGSDRHRLLLAFSVAGPMTDEEAGRVAEVGGYNDKRRCSDLRRMGLIEPTGETRETGQGAQAMVCRITFAGKRALGHADVDREDR